MVDYVVSIKILPSGDHILAATKNGQVVKPSQVLNAPQIIVQNFAETFKSFDNN